MVADDGQVCAGEAAVLRRLDALLSRTSQSANVDSHRPGAEVESRSSVVVSCRCVSKAFPWTAKDAGRRVPRGCSDESVPSN